MTDELILPQGFGSMDKFGRQLGDRWMKVSDGLPLRRGKYLVVKGDPFGRGEVAVSWFAERYAGEEFRFPASVTYWQQLPAMPQKRFPPAPESHKESNDE